MPAILAITQQLMAAEVQEACGAAPQPSECAPDSSLVIADQHPQRDNKLGQADNCLKPEVRQRLVRAVRPRALDWLSAMPYAATKPQLAPLHVQQLLNAKNEGLSAKSIRYIRGTLRTALNQVRWELLGRNPASLVDGPRVGHYEIRPFTPEEARVFLAAMKGDRLEALYSVALTMGLRQGEALGLCWNEVDLEMGYLRVSKQLQRFNGESRLVEPKTARSRRTLALPASIVRSLKEHRNRQQFPNQHDHEHLYPRFARAPTTSRRSNG